MTWRTWRNAMEDALYGEEGFFRTQAPGDHFRTSTHASPLFAGAVLTLAHRLGARQVVDVGAGRGELLIALHGLDPGLSLIGVDLADRPGDLPAAIEWRTSPPGEIGGLVIANEWLDNVPVDIAEASGPDPAGRPDSRADLVVRLVEVDDAGTERPGPPITDADAEWVARWWPLTEPDTCAEIGRPRDDAWASLVQRLTPGGVAVAIDYTHLRDSRPYAGTLTAYQAGSIVRPAPDGTCDLTAHVAIDAVRSAGEAAGATTLECASQRDLLQQLGVDADRPDLALARDDPHAYLQALNRTGEAAELLDPAGLGGFTWLVQRR